LAWLFAIAAAAAAATAAAAAEASCSGDGNAGGGGGGVEFGCHTKARATAVAPINTVEQGRSSVGD
jgi:hypothetical protein